MTQEIDQSALRLVLEDAIRKHDIVVPNLSITRERLPDEVIRHCVRADAGCFSSISLPDGVFPCPDTQWVYPEIVRFEVKTVIKIEHKNIEDAIDELALDLVRQKERLFFKIIEASCKAAEPMRHINHSVESLTPPLSCSECNNDVPPIAAVRNTLQSRPDAVYADAGGVNLIFATKEAYSWFTPATRREEVEEQGYIGTILGMPIFSDAFRDKKMEASFGDLLKIIEEIANTGSARLDPGSDPSLMTRSLSRIDSVRYVAVHREGIRHDLPHRFADVLVSNSGEIHASHHASITVIGDSAAINEHHIQNEEAE